MEFIAEPAWWVSILIGSFLTSIVATYAVRHLDKGKEAFFSRRRRRLAERNVAVARRRSEMLASATARSRYARHAAGLLGESSLWAAMAAVTTSILVGIGLSKSPLWLFVIPSFMTVHGIHMSFRYWLRHMDLEDEIDHVERELIRAEIGT